MRVITFSRVFQATHPKAGEPTYFVEKIMASLADCIKGWKMYDDFTIYDWHEYYNATPKHHTIRAGHRWKEGDWFPYKVGTVFTGQIICWNESVNYCSTELPNPERSASQPELNSSNDA